MLRRLRSGNQIRRGVGGDTRARIPRAIRELSETPCPFCWQDVVLVLIACIVLAAPAALAPSHTFRGGIGGDLTVSVASYKETKYRSVIKQKYDFSCGSAAVATLLTHHYGLPTTETEAFNAMFEAGDRDKIRKKGFSLLDMKSYLERRGLRADGYRLSLDALADLGVPAIVLINAGGYKHFVVVKGIKDGVVLYADPARGLERTSAQRFSDMSEGITFLVKDQARMARASFNDAKDWKARQGAPLGAADGQIGISEFPLSLPGPGDLY